MDSVEREDFIDLLELAAIEVESINKDNGWFEDNRTFGEDIALLHSEVSEALEEFRDGRMVTLYEFKQRSQYPLGGGSDLDDEMSYDDETGTMRIHGTGEHGKPVGMPSELADILVRLLDTARRYKVNLGEEFFRKLAYNKTRGYKHGGKAL